MTMPFERSRNVVQAGEFLAELMRDTRLPHSVRDEARRLLRHYPTPHDVHMAGIIEEKAAKNSFIGPVFSSEFDGSEKIKL